MSMYVQENIFCIPCSFALVLALASKIEVFLIHSIVSIPSSFWFHLTGILSYS